jgi:hypothetical protein
MLRKANGLASAFIFMRAAARFIPPYSFAMAGISSTSGGIQTA